MKDVDTLESISLTMGMKEIELENLINKYGGEAERMYKVYWKEADTRIGYCHETITPLDYVHTLFKKIKYAKARCDWYFGGYENGI